VPGTVVFDGHCGLCTRLVKWAARLDRRGAFRFEPLESEAGAALSREHGVDPTRPHTILLVKDGRAWYRSDAVLEIARELPWVRWPARLAALVPRRLRDRAYGFVARHRYRWFGRRE
jgi:predicted DCC family thiol-disulfide oxidoreductase YuxK